MNNDYSDIRDKIAEEPSWWDENAVPRYCPFRPRECANIYARECALLQIECQGCGHEFLVAITHSIFNEGLPSVADRIRLHTIHFGDPPNTGCCPAGATMNSVPRKVREYWKRDQVMEWVRDPSFETEIDHRLIGKT